jgi:iron complex outermembrane receptor protein
VPGSSSTSAAITTNAGEARIQGGELEITALLGPMRVATTLGITDGEYTKLAPGTVEVKPGSNFLNTPDTTASLALDVPIAFGFADLDLHADYSWRDEVAFAYDPSSPARQEAYGLLNAMVMARFRQLDLELRLWARNLLDERYLARIVDNNTIVTAIPGQPRTYGASLTWRFGSR